MQIKDKVWAQTTKIFHNSNFSNNRIKWWENLVLEVEKIWE